MRVSLPIARHHPRFAAAVRRAERAIRWTALFLIGVSAASALVQLLGWLS